MVIGRGRRREHPQPRFCTTTNKKSRGKPGMCRDSSGHVTSVISGEKAPLGRMLCNFRLRMLITHFRTGHGG